MRRPNILIGMTGSVATILAGKLTTKMDSLGKVASVFTQAATRFFDPVVLEAVGTRAYTDYDEWQFDPGPGMPDDKGQKYASIKRDDTAKWHKDDPVLHIELRDWADVLVIAPLSANTLAKAANGICDNLLTSIVRAWEPHKPIVLAPAMNTVMWESPFTDRHLETLDEIFPLSVVQPVEKKLACGDVGKGGLADIDDIVDATRDALRWQFPIDFHWTRGVPTGHHPGAFGFQRKHDIHDGVDIYVPEFLDRGDAQVTVKAVEPGTVIAIAPFTGPKVGMPWWEDTDVVLVHGKSGVVGYGEIRPRVEVGQKLRRGDEIGWVTEVLKHGKRREDIPGHSRAMLHLALYEPGHRDWNPWHPGQDVDDHIDPTPLLQDSIGWPGKLPQFEGEL